jgi:glycosyltransferase involved in cell wall biosynthesis
VRQDQETSPSSTTGQRPLRVAIDARVREGVSGGVQQAIIGLASGLSQLDGPERYFFLVDREPASWLSPYLAGPCSLLPATPRPAALAKHLLKRFAPRTLLDSAYNLINSLLPVSVATSDGTIEQAGIDVMHFALQHGFRTDIPNIYLPHDLQHVHLPELFGRADLRSRRAVYPALCRQAASVVAFSQWGKRDLESSYGIPPEKIRVIPWGPVVEAYVAPGEQGLTEVRRRYALPDAFAFFPAQTFRHKNHLRLLDALALLRDRDGQRVELVCSGYRDDFYPALARRARELHLEQQVRFLGFLDTAELQCMYRLARLLVFPSRFEGFGMPVLEAFRLGLPVACSRAASLPELAGDAALLFDPERTVELAAALKRLWTEPVLRAELSARGSARASSYGWRRTALNYRALYRLLGGRPLSADDRTLLAAT